MTITSIICEQWDDLSERAQLWAVRTNRIALLRTGADTDHESAEEWYDSYGAHLSTEHCGDVTVQSVEYRWLDDTNEDAISALRCEEPRMMRAEARGLVAMARDVREAAEMVEASLSDAVDSYLAHDAGATIEALAIAGRAERDHRDDPATCELAKQLLTPAGLNQLRARR